MTLPPIDPPSDEELRLLGKEGIVIQESQGGQKSLSIPTLNGRLTIHDGVAGPEFVVAGSTVRIPANAVADVIEWLWKWERKYLEERG